MNPQINPALTGFKCLGPGHTLPVDDYFKGCPTCAQHRQATSVVATYDPDAHWQQNGRMPIQNYDSLGEGHTPVLDIEPNPDSSYSRIRLKLEGLNPTGSHKDRMSVYAVARAKQTRHSSVLVASSGNAGVSAAAYANRAGLSCTIYTQKSTSDSWLGAMNQFGASVERLDSSMERWSRLSSAVDAGEGFPLTNFLHPPVGSNPFGLQGYKTIAYELASDIPDRQLDAIVVPVARGDLLWGIWTGLTELAATNAWEKLPIMIAVEPFPRASAALNGAGIRGSFPGYTTQSSIGGAWVTHQTLNTLKESGGLAVEVGDRTAEQARKRLVSSGIELEACSAATLAALDLTEVKLALPKNANILLVGTSNGYRDNASCDNKP